MESGIYKIESKYNPDHIYIGSAVNIKTRWNVHLHLLRNNKHANKKLQNHFNKYSESDLVFIIIEPCFPEFLTIREQYYIDTLNPYFNILSIAGSWLNYHHTKESREKMCISQKGNKNGLGKKRSDETKRKQSETMLKNGYVPPSRKGMKFSKETLNQMSDSQKRIGNKPPSWLGKTHSEETKKKMRLASIGKDKSRESVEKRINTCLKNETFKGINNPMFGKHHSDETKMKIIETRRLNKIQKIA
jgi:group I intron endonuclease